MIDIIDFDKLKEEQETKQEQEEKAVAIPDMTEKSMADVSLSDVHFKLNTDQTYEQQAKDVVNAKAIAEAVQDKTTIAALAKGKQNELIGEQQAKITKTKKDLKDSETELQRAEYDSNKTLFDTFNIVSHLPKWLQYIVVPLLTPFFLIGVLVIKVPCGFVRMLIDELMRVKIDECDRFLNGKDAAIERRDLARVELEAAEAALAEYDNSEYVETVTNYRDGLKKRLGIVDEPEMVSEAEHDGEQDSAPIIVETVEQPLI